MTRALAVLALSLLGCSAHISGGLLADEVWKQTPVADPKQFDHQVLFQREHFRFRVEPRKSFTDIERHQVLRVLTENGRRFASQKWRWGADAELISILGRTVGPDGKVTVLDRSQVFFTHDADGNGHAQLSFQLPNAEVGSVLEFAFVVSAEGLLAEDHKELRTDAPLEHYEVQFDVNTGLEYGFRVYNTDTKADEDDDIAYHVVKWHADHLTPRSQEEYGWAPSPRWAFRLTDFQLGRAKATFAHGWDDVFKHELTRVSLPEFSEGLPEVDVHSCGESAKCKTREVWRAVHRLTDTTQDGELDTARPLATVAASRFASRHEQVLLFRALAASAGLSTDLVFVTNPYKHDFDREFPTTLHDDVLAWVRPAGDLPQGLFVDASCESCQPGTVREAVNHAEGVRTSVVAYDERHVQSSGALTTVVAEDAIADELENQVELVVDPSGDLTVSHQTTARGDAAVKSREIYRRSKVSEQADAELSAKQAYPGAVLLSSAAHEIDKEAGRFSHGYRYRVPQGVTAVDRNLVVPLSAIAHRHRTFEPKSRTEEINVTSAGVMRESITVRLPPGWHVVEGPKAYDGIGAGFNGKVVVGGSASTWTVMTELIRKRGRWPASSYAKAREVVHTLASVGEQSIVLAKD